MSVFSYESKFSQVVLRFTHGCYLNLLWAVTSLPIVTMGAATTALYTVTFKIARNEDGDLTSQFFRAFKQNFKQATTIWLILLAIGAVLGLDIYVLNGLRTHTHGAMAVICTIGLALVIAACIAFVVELMYVFPLVAMFENTNSAMMKNALLIGTHYLFCTICVFVIYAAMAVAVIALFTPLAVAGVGVCALASSYLLWPVLRANATEPDSSAGETKLLP